MPPLRIPKISYLRRVFIVTHLTGLLAGLLIPLLVAPLCGQDGLHPGFFLACLTIGYLMGAASYVFVHQTLRHQLAEQIRILGMLGGGGDGLREGTLESMTQTVQSSMAQIEDLVKTILVTVDNILPHYQKMTDGIHYLAERARIGLNAGQASRDSIEGMAERYRTVLEQTHLLAERIQEEAALSRELSASLEEMAEALEHSSGKFLETTASVEEMAASIREVAAQSSEVSRMIEGTSQDLEAIGETFDTIRREADGGAKASQAVKEDAERGLGAAKNSVAEMDKIEEESRNASTAMERLATQTGEVEMIIEVIRELVSDTELLAFNAAIIAAQAGEEGKGFSVVADEIRDLADRTAASAGEIHRIIQAIGTETRKVMGAVKATSRRIDEGKHAFESAEGALRKIVGSAKKAADFSFEIARMTEREGGRARNQLEEAGRTLRSVQAITRAMKEQEEAIFRIQDGVEEMKAASDRISRGMEEQVKANQSFDQGLAERDTQVRGVQETMQYLLDVTRQVVKHFEDSIERLRGNVTRTSTLSSEVRELEGLTSQLRKLVESVDQQVASDV